MIDVVHIAVAMKPVEGNFASNALEHGVSGLNVDGCRVETNGEKTGGNGYWVMSQSKGWNPNSVPYKSENRQSTSQGRWPANVILDGSDEVKAEFPFTSVTGRRTGSHGGSSNGNENEHKWKSMKRGTEYADDSGSAARFFQECKGDKDR